MIRYVDAYTLEPGTTARRRVVVDTIVLHYFAAPDLHPEARSRESKKRLIERAREAGSISNNDANGLFCFYVIDGNPMPDSVMLCLTADANLERKASWHYAVSSCRKGEEAAIVRYVPEEVSAHHVGDASYPTNQRSIGIEVAHPGPVPRKIACYPGAAKAAADWYREHSGWIGGVQFLPCPDGLKRWFMLPTQACYAAVVELLVDICRRRKEIVAIASHYTFAPSKRIDPDPPFNLADIRSEVGAIVGRELLPRAKGPAKPIR